MVSIPDEFRDLFEKKTLAHLATLMPDGAPHVAPLWVDYDESANRLLVDTERGFQKEVNVRNDPRVAISMTDPDNPYRMLSVRGTVEELTTEGAREHLDQLARRYLEKDEYPLSFQTEPVTITIQPEHVSKYESPIHS